MVSMTSPTRLSLTLGIALLAGISCRDDNNNAGPTGPAELEELSAAAASNTWATKRPLSPWRKGAAAGAINGKVYVAGGWGRNSPIARVDAYDIARDTWTQVASMPAARADVNGGTVINNKLYVSGGINRAGVQTRSLFVYDPATNQWTQKADVPRASCGGDQGEIGGRLYVYTGCWARENMGAVFFRYNPSTNIWVKRPAPPVDHASGAGAAIGGRFYVNGGFAPSCGGTCGGNTHTVDVYDAASNTWMMTRPGRGSHHTTAATLNGRLYIIGGESETFDWTVEAYDPTNNTWQVKAPLPRGSLLGMAATENRKIYYLEGATMSSIDPSRLYVYTP
jgi:N-acetylneuraminic acid mutarotase